MGTMNISELITKSILETLERSSGTIQIQRNEMASQLGCVPSQINYVITSRFTPEQGYLVESKRGGGGYIRIIKINSDSRDMIMHVVNSIGTEIDENSARIILQNLCSDKLLTKKEGKIILSAMSNHVLRHAPPEARGKLRASILKTSLLNSLEEEE